MNDKIIVGLDIGTSKVCALAAAQSNDQEKLNILGIGITESEGLNRGVVTNIEKTVNTIKTVITQAEQQAGIKIEEVIVGIAGDHIESFQTRGIVGISSPTQEITQADVDRLIENAGNFKLPSERSIIHIMPQDFIIDGQDGIIDPIGMNGVRLEANVHIITGLNTAIKNINTCVERAGVKVKDVVLEPIASSTALLSEEEKEVGVALIDIGGGTTDIAVFEENIIRFTSIFGLAGKHVSYDIRKGLGIIAGQAERIKREYGHCFGPSILKDEMFMIPGIGGRNPMEVSKTELCAIIQPRMEELFEFALHELNSSGFYDRLGAGVIITGGTCLLEGTEKLAEQVLGLPVKLGIPSGIKYTGLGPEIESPVYSTGVGLTMYGIENELTKEVATVKPEMPEQPKEIKIENTVLKETKKEKTSKKSENKNKDNVSVFAKMKNFIEQL